MNLNTRVKHELAPGGQGHADYVVVEESPDLLKDPAGYSRLVFRAVASQIDAMIRPLRGRIVVDHNGEGILGRLVAELGEVSTYGYVMPALSAAEILSYVVPYVNVVTVKQLLALGIDPEMFHLCQEKRVHEVVVSHPDACPFNALTIDATIGVFGCPPTVVKFQPQVLKTEN
jgi:hypothetical protein